MTCLHAMLQQQFRLRQSWLLTQHNIYASQPVRHLASCRLAQHADMSASQPVRLFLPQPAWHSPRPGWPCANAGRVINIALEDVVLAKQDVVSLVSCSSNMWPVLHRLHAEMHLIAN